MHPHHSLSSTRPRILLVDDDETLTMTLGRVLSGEGFEVRVANDAYKGIVLARLNVPSLVILDVQMPGMDGYAFIDEFRTIPGCTDVPIFLATGATDVSTARRRIAGQGVVLLLPKPFKVETLVSAAQGAIRSHAVTHTRTRAVED